MFVHIFALYVGLGVAKRIPKSPDLPLPHGPWSGSFRDHGLRPWSQSPCARFWIWSRRPRAQGVGLDPCLLKVTREFPSRPTKTPLEIAKDSSKTPTKVPTKMPTETPTDTPNPSTSAKHHDTNGSYVGKEKGA